MAVLLERVKPVVRQIVREIRLQVEKLREKLNEFFEVHPVYGGLVYTPQEERMIDASAEIMRDFFPAPPGPCLMEEDFESRCETLEDLGRSLMDCYGLEDVEIVITDSEDAFPGKKAKYTYGFTSFSAGRIYINANYLRVDDGAALERVVIALLHELRHMVQYQIVTLRDTRHVPFERRSVWRHNIVNYIEAEYDMRGYAEQPIEFDARNFANRVWQRAYGGRAV